MNRTNGPQDDLLKLMPDFARISKRFVSGKGTLEDVVRAYQAVCCLPDFVDMLQRLGREKNGNVWEVVDESLVVLVEEIYLNKLRVG